MTQKTAVKRLSMENGGDSEKKEQKTGKSYQIVYRKN
jgi:hypothetical protein